LPSGPRLLVVDDDANIRLMVGCSLQYEGYAVLLAADGEEALRLSATEMPNLIVLDLMLPKIDGREVCRRIRASSMVPILMLTARATESDKVEGLELGADDYLTKPFSLRELSARIKALLRRASAEEPQLAITVTIGGLTVDPRARTAQLDGRPLRLTPTEFRLLSLLAARPGEVLSSKHLVRLLHNYTCTDQEAFDLIRMSISRLRQKIELNPTSPRYIHTVRGFGYTLSWRALPVGTTGSATDHSTATVSTVAVSEA